MDFRQLEYVITVAREKTLLSAAKKLFLSPSALSQHISKLEEELRTPLFKRTKQGWLPTSAGQVYIQMAESVLLQKNTGYGLYCQTGFSCIQTGFVLKKMWHMFLNFQSW